MSARTSDYELIILDRDGVINHDSDAYIKTVDEWIPIEGSIEAIGRLCQAGYRIAVATNQSGLARGYYTPDVLAHMHRKMTALVAEQGGVIEYIAVCPHGPDDACSCRKPLPGLLQEIARQTGMSLGTRTLMVGDKDADLEAGRAAGCDVALVRTGKGARTEPKLATHPDPAIREVRIFDTLAALADHLIA